MSNWRLSDLYLLASAGLMQGMSQRNPMIGSGTTIYFLVDGKVQMQLPFAGGQNYSSQLIMTPCEGLQGFARIMNRLFVMI
jgi:hypothetical protein